MAKVTDPYEFELKHAAGILTVKEWIKKRIKVQNKYVVYANSTPIDSIIVNRPYNFK